jgi:hypothetical protein
LGDREQRYKAINQHLDSIGPTALASLANFEYDPEGILVGQQRYPILVMEWIDGPTLDVYLEAALQNRAVLLHLADQWIKVVKGLRDAQVAHGDLQHGNIIVQNGMLRLVDLDGMFVPSMSKMNSSELGHRHYQHPTRDQFFFNRDLDNFSALVIHLSFTSLAERPDLWKKFHDENLIFARPDFLNPTKSPVFSEVRNIGTEHKRLADFLEKASQSIPSSTPALPDLVTPASKLPSWMAAPPGVVISTRTREVIPGQALSGASSSPVSSPAAGAAGQSHTVPITTSATPVAFPPLQTAAQIDWNRVRIETVSIAVKFGLTGLLFIWAWYPLLNGIYRDFGFQADSESLTIWTYILGSLGFGFFRAIQKAKTSARGVAPSPRPATPATSPAYSPPPIRYPRSTPSHSVAVVGSKIRLIYHRPSCEWARKISARNKVSFASTADARAAGYRRCGVCSP